MSLHGIGPLQNGSLTECRTDFDQDKPASWARTVPRPRLVVRHEVEAIIPDHMRNHLTMVSHSRAKPKRTACCNYSCTGESGNGYHVCIL